ncbi:Protein phosphatase 2C [Tolypocladium ophioglossoides CBS 100239]|uniref:Protein phosphatase 2C n=1 Tax=Tolypocladium ophioglossoides (strain CBS 100239) TaxID=1163406 RepID=A0A0L0N5N0_TOLOC|nr:Protein phosphatase 2C [Tolypocladium ophioglossoides CBS 100239]
MFRQAAGVTRVVARPSIVKPRAQHLRWNSSATTPTRCPKLPWALGLLAAGGAGYCLGRGSSDRTSSSTPAPAPRAFSSAPGIPSAASEADIPVASPVTVLGLVASNAKIREQAQSFVFANGPTQGRVDVVRVSSNNPVEDEWAVGVGRGLGGGEALYVGVYDGHAGWATSAVLKQALIRYVSGALSQLPPSSDGDIIDSAIKNAFTRLDDRIMAAARQATESSAAEHGAASAIRALAPAIAGSCALLSVYDAASSTLRTAVTGDSRAVLGVWSPAAGVFDAEALSKDQTGFNEDEVRRLDAEHPGELADMIDPKSGRLMGIAVTRAFGDHRWKWPNEAVSAAQARLFGYEPRPKSKTPPYMTARPEVTTRRVSSSDFAILASDGLWDVISDADAVTCVERWLAANKAGRPESVTPGPSKFTVGDDGYASWKATPGDFAIEDLDSAAVCLVKNALGGRRRGMFCGAMTAYSPLSRYVRDDITVQVIFFRDPYGNDK